MKKDEVLVSSKFSFSAPRRRRVFFADVDFVAVDRAIGRCEFCDRRDKLRAVWCRAILTNPDGSAAERRTWIGWALYRQVAHGILFCPDHIQAVETRIQTSVDAIAIHQRKAA